MSLENEIVVIVPLKEKNIDLKKRHRDQLFFDKIYEDLDHTTLEEDDVFWDLGRSSYEKDGVKYVDYQDVLPFAEHPEHLKDYFERGKGETIRLFNLASVSKIGESVSLSVFEQRLIFLRNLGDIEKQIAVWNVFKDAEKLDNHKFVLTANSEIDFLKTPIDASIIREIDKDLKRSEYMTYFSHYNRGQVYLKNQYQTLTSLSDSQGNTQSTMSSMWASHATGFIRLPEAKLSVFANVEDATGVDVNKYFIHKDLEVDLRTAGLNWLSLSSNRRLYIDNNIDSLAKVFDGVLLRYQQKDWIQSFSPTVYLKVADQDPTDVNQKIVRGFLCKYFSAQEMRGVEVGLQSTQNSVDLGNQSSISGGSNYAI